MFSFSIAMFNRVLVSPACLEVELNPSIKHLLITILPKATKWVVYRHPGIDIYIYIYIYTNTSIIKVVQGLGMVSIPL